jgi:cell division protein FtsN
VKRLFVLLLIGNLVLAGWGYYRSQHRPAIQTPASGGNLLLLSERDAGMSLPEPQESEALPAESTHLPAASSLDEEEADGRVRIALPAPTPSVEAPAEPPALPQRQPEPEPERLAMAREPEPAAESEAEPDRMPDPGAAQELVLTSKAKLLQCHSLGAFESAENAAAVAGELASVGVAATLREQTVQRSNGFWVLIPPMRDRSAAVAMERRLREVGVKDIWRVPQGDLAHAISLGLFSRRPSAERRRNQILGQGFPAEVRPRYTETEEYWLDFPVGGRVDAQDLKRRLAREYRQIHLIQRECVRVGMP